eukprot:IDg10107t1
MPLVIYQRKSNNDIKITDDDIALEASVVRLL